MAAISIDLNMKRRTNEAFIKKACACAPKLIEKELCPESIVTIDTNQFGKVVIKKRDMKDSDNRILSKGEKICFDFGHHQVGYITLKIGKVGSPQDAPAYFRLKFGEMAKELLEDSTNYDGWISKGWIQEEEIHVDVLPTELKLPRRYAFRYVQVEVIDTSLKWKLSIDDIMCKSVSAVDMSKISRYEISDNERQEISEAGIDEEFLKKIDEVSLRTLQNCMQDVFEDGPKRDRRLWLGDLRLQALANYETFELNSLVKRCLYLFAGTTREDGKIGACLFTKPEYIVDDTFFFDYSLFFVSALYDYYQNTKDMETLSELWPSALRQIELANMSVNENNLVVIEGDFTCFIDWKDGLDKQASAHAIYIYCLNQAKVLAGILGEQKSKESLERSINVLKKAALEFYWKQELGLFVSGENQQISYASQVWMILAGVVTPAEGQKILVKIISLDPEMGMVSPYMNHHYTESLIICGMKKEALKYMKYYWGGMLEQGADTFWELYNPKNPEESPYGSSIVNSYCHAWSCTPTYLLRKYYQ